ncbi:unnamed protein product [Leptosia nina]|uniref:Uncharacterized protein n=1 Tax=Leptosia nina TaxID=320188 RepID=A0AAV1JH03_9NEOP
MLRRFRIMQPKMLRTVSRSFPRAPVGISVRPHLNITGFEHFMAETLNHSTPPVELNEPSILHDIENQEELEDYENANDTNVYDDSPVNVSVLDNDTDTDMEEYSEG